MQLSIDADLQRLSYRLLQGKKGAALTIKPSTGEILSAVSSPGFNPEKIEANWELYSQSEEHLLFNRAFQGLYPPGSTFKLITFAAALENNSQNQERQFYCPGFIEINGRTLNCIAAHGDINLKDGLAFSCNVVFAQLGMELGENLLRKQAEQAGLDRNLDLGFPVKASKFSSGKEISLNGVAESSIGQGQVAVTPLEMALITAAVANDGVLMQPYLLKAKGPVGQNLESFDKPKILTRLMKDSTAAYLKEAMGAVIAYGTGWQAQIPGIKVAGKTGSAENPHGSAHAWFIGFAPLEDPEIAVAVVVENAGSGGSHAAPIAREIIRQALTRTFNN